MNKNIEVINENLWAVNFDYVKSGYVKELTFIETNVSDLGCITNDGRFVLNKGADDYDKYIPFIKNIMELTDDELNTIQGFYIIIKKIIKSFKDYTDEQIENTIQKYKLTYCKQIFIQISQLEQTRRDNKKQYIKSNKKHFGIKTIIKKFKRKGV